MSQALPSRQTKKWTQPNTADTQGTLSRTRNMDFDSETYAKLAKRIRAVFSEADDADFVRPISITFNDTIGEYLITTAGHLFKMALDEAVAPVDDSGTANAPSMDSNGYSDSLNWQGYTYISGVSSLRRYNGTYSASLYALTSGGPLCVHEKKNYLAIGQGNTVLLLDTSHTLVVTLTIPADLYVTSIDFSGNSLYVGTRHINNGEAIFYEWDGNTAAANNSWGVGAPRINSVKKYDTTIAIITSTGRLLRFTGGGFTQMAALPVYFTDLDWDRPGSANLGRVIHRGMMVEDDLIFINICPRILLPNSAVNDPLLYSWFPGGIWCYDPKVGLYHRMSFSSSQRSRTSAVTTASINTATNIITVASATVPMTGTPVIYDAAGSTAAAPLTDGTKYYAIYVSDTTMKLATSLANATVGTAIDLTGTGNNSQRFVFLPNRDFGGTAIVGGVGGLTDGGCAIALLRQGSSNGVRASTGRRFIFGAKIGTSTVTEKYALCLAATNQENRGSLVTAKIPSSVIKDKIQNFSVKYRGIKTVEDMIVPKYRTIERANVLNTLPQSLLQSGTWTAAFNSFNTAADLTNVRKGDEVEIVNGSGAGILAHITDLVYDSTLALWGVYLDETAQNVAKGDTFYFYTDNWTKCETAPITIADNDLYENKNGDTDTADGGTKPFSVSSEGKWLEIKLELRGEDVEIEEIFINNIPLRQFV